MKRKVIIDTDPGHDDMMAILLAGQYCELLGITTVNGNTYVERVTQNALKIVEFSGLTSIPVVRGAAVPLIEPLRQSPMGHGLSGLDGLELPEPSTPVTPGHAVDFIIDTVRAVSDVSIVAIGPLTNLALALRCAPEIAGRIVEISLMGGSATVGNSAPVSESNIAVDPEAAAIVFGSGVPIKMAGLHLTRQALATPERMARIRAIGTETSRIVAGLLDWYNAKSAAAWGLPGAALHDPIAVGWLLDPSLIESVKAHVDVELHGKRTRGMTVCDLRFLRLPGGSSSGGGGIRGSLPPNAEIGMKIDADRFFDLLIGAVGRYA